MMNYTMNWILLVCILVGLFHSTSTRSIKPRHLHARSLKKSNIGDTRCQQFQIIKQNVDHFGFSNMDTYDQRYILNVDQWQHGKPIFFYAGNEGSLQ
jgi:hypothetical protein